MKLKRRKSGSPRMVNQSGCTPGRKIKLFTIPRSVRILPVTSVKDFARATSFCAILVTVIPAKSAPHAQPKSTTRKATRGNVSAKARTSSRFVVSMPSGNG